MESWYFTEMPYPHLPPLDTIDNMRVAVPNRLYDPRILRLFLPTCDAEQNAALFAVPRFLVCEDTDPDKLLLHSENDGNAALRSLPLVGGVAAS